MLIQEEESPNLLYQVLHQIQIIYRKKIDPYILYKKTRWLLIVALALLYVNRVLNISGFYVISYLLGMYHMQLMLEYLTPLGLPAVNAEDEEEEENVPLEFMDLPTSLTNKEDNERRPLLRTSSEFKIWQQSLLSFLICYTTTYIPILDIPVYWPFLVGYFLSIFFMTFKKYRKHMRKYGYSIFDFTKK